MSPKAIVKRKPRCLQGNPCYGNSQQNRCTTSNRSMDSTFSAEYCRIRTDFSSCSLLLRLVLALGGGGCRGWGRGDGSRPGHARHSVDNIVRRSERVERRSPDGLGQGARAEKHDYECRRHDYRLPFHHVAGGLTQIPSRERDKGVGNFVDSQLT